MSRKELIILFVVLSVTAISRILIPWNNFSPIGAIALLGGAMIGKKWLAYALPLLSLFFGDLVLSSVSPLYSNYIFSSSFAFVYIAFAAIVALGVYISKHLKVSNVIIMSLVASVLFFLITNFGAWMYHGMYPLTTGGLVAAYIAGIPFFTNTLISQVVFSLALYFAAHYSLSRKTVLA